VCWFSRPEAGGGDPPPAAPHFINFAKKRSETRQGGQTQKNWNIVRTAARQKAPLRGVLQADYNV